MMTVFKVNSNGIVLRKSILFFFFCFCIKYELLSSFCRCPFMFNIYSKWEHFVHVQTNGERERKNLNARTLFNRTANGKFQNVFMYSVHNCLCFGNAMRLLMRFMILTKKCEEKSSGSKNRHTNLFFQLILMSRNDFTVLWQNCRWFEFIKINWVIRQTKHFVVFKTCVMQQCTNFNELPLIFCTDIYIMVGLIFLLLFLF